MTPATRHYRRTVAILACGGLTYAISQTMVAPALPHMQEEFGASASSVAWVMSAFFISSAVLTGIFGRLGDMFGKKRMLLITLGAYVVGAVIAALAQTLTMVIVGRIIMGGGGGVFPLAYAIARDELPARRVPVALGTISMTTGLGAGLGMPIGGAFAEYPGFEWSFVLAAILSALTLGASALLIRESPVRFPAKVDWLGGALLMAGLGILLTAISRASTWTWLAPQTVGLGVAGLALLVLLVAVERRRPQPLLHIPTLSRRPVLFTNLTSLLLGGGQIAASLLVVQFAQVPAAAGGVGVGALQAGMFLIPYSLFMVAGSQIAGRAALRFGAKRPLLIGTTTATTGMLLLAGVPTAHLALYTFPAIAGLGVGMAMASATILVSLNVPLSRSAEANGINTIARNVGQSLGVQITAAILAGGTVAAGSVVAEPASFSTAFLFSAGACAAAFAAGLLVPGRRASVEDAPGVDGDGLARGALGAYEGEQLLGDVVAERGALEHRVADAPADLRR